MQVEHVDDEAGVQVEPVDTHDDEVADDDTYEAGVQVEPVDTHDDEVADDDTYDDVRQHLPPVL